MLPDERRNMTDSTMGNAGLTQMLSERREMQDDVQSRSEGRFERSIEVRDDLDQSDADFQRDLELAALQMTAPRP
jgi:hypothetical protein